MFSKSVIVGAIIVVGTGLLSAVPVEAKHCKSKRIWVRGDTKISCLSACASAKAAWRSEVKRRYGSKYADYSIASGARVVCVEAGGIKEWCSASGKPCRP